MDSIIHNKAKDHQDSGFSQRLLLEKQQEEVRKLLATVLGKDSEAVMKIFDPAMEAKDTEEAMMTIVQNLLDGYDQVDNDEDNHVSRRLVVEETIKKTVATFTAALKDNDTSLTIGIQQSLNNLRKAVEATDSSMEFKNHFFKLHSLLNDSLTRATTSENHHRLLLNEDEETAAAEEPSSIRTILQDMIASLVAALEQQQQANAAGTIESSAFDPAAAVANVVMDGFKTLITTLQQQGDDISALFDTGGEDNLLVTILVIAGIALLLIITSPIWVPILTLLAPFLLVGVVAVGIYLLIDGCHQVPPEFEFCPGNKTKTDDHDESDKQEPWNSQ
jgi:hypothetical protein